MNLSKLVSITLRNDIVLSNKANGNIAEVSHKNSNNVKIKNGICILEGYNIGAIHASITDTFGSVAKTIFETVHVGRITLYEWFIVELVYILDYMINTSKEEHKVAAPLDAKYFLAQLKKTWIDSYPIVNRVDMRLISAAMKWKPLDHQVDFFNFYNYATSKGQLTGAVANMAAGTGKALDLDTLVLTTKGWIKNKDIKVGDLVVGSNGKSTAVTGVYPQGITDRYKVTFIDGTSMVSSGDHLWKASNDAKLTKGQNHVTLITTAEIKNALYKGDMYSIPLASAWVTKDVELPVDAYTLGDNIDSCNVSSYIPKLYLTAGLNQRLNMLNGLLGSNNGRISYTTTSKNLAAGLCELIRSLGRVVKVTNSEVAGINIWNINEIELFDNYKQITAIDKITPGETKCISVDTPDHLFIAEGYNLTHNTYTSLAIAVGVKEIERVIILCPKVAFKDPWLDSIKDLYKSNSHEVYVINNRPPKGYERFILCNYDSIKKLSKHLSKMKKVVTLMILDESHNLNEMSASRTHDYIGLSKKYVTETIHLSGTPIKARVQELIPFLTVTDKRFVKEVAKKFHKAMPVHGTIINNRMKRLALTVEKDAIGRKKPEAIDLHITCKNGHLYTMEAIKDKMEKYAIERLKYWMSIREESIKTYYDYIEQVNHLDTVKYDEFNTNLDIILDTTNYRVINDAIVMVSKYENDIIMPQLDIESKKGLRYIRAAAKYPKLKVLGETLGVVLGGLRRDCSAELADNLDLTKIATTATGKIVAFSNHVKAATAMYKSAMDAGMSPLLIHANHYSEGDTEVNTDPNALNKILHIFKNDPSANPLCTTYSTLSTAVPLTMVSEVVLIDTPFREYILTQAIARADRLGNDNDVTAYFVMLDTGEELNITDRNLDLAKTSGEHVAAILDIDTTVEYPDI